LLLSAIGSVDDDIDDDVVSAASLVSVGDVGAEASGFASVDGDTTGTVSVDGVVTTDRSVSGLLAGADTFTDAGSSFVTEEGMVSGFRSSFLALVATGTSVTLAVVAGASAVLVFGGVSMTAVVTGGVSAKVVVADASFSTCGVGSAVFESTAFSGCATAGGSDVVGGVDVFGGSTFTATIEPLRRSIGAGAAVEVVGRSTTGCADTVEFAGGSATRVLRTFVEGSTAGGTAIEFELLERLMTGGATIEFEFVG